MQGFCLNGRATLIHWECISVDDLAMNYELMQDYGTQGRLDTNDSLRLASLWHSMHAISKELSPVGGCSGVELLEADTFDLHCFQALTGTKLFSNGFLTFFIGDPLV